MEYGLVGLTAGNAAGNRGGVKNTGTGLFFWLPAVLLRSFLPGHSHADGFGLRFELPQDVAASMVLTVAAAANSRVRRCGVTVCLQLRRGQQVPHLSGSQGFAGEASLAYFSAVSDRTPALRLQASWNGASKVCLKFPSWTIGVLSG